MKKMVTKLMSLLLIASIIFSTTVFAATTYYLTVTLTGPDRKGITQTVSGTSSRYSTLNSTIVSEVISAMGPESYRSELESKFALTGMRVVFDDGVVALAAGSKAWNEFLDKYQFFCANESLTRNYAATFADLQAVGGTSTVSYGAYQVTVTLNSYTSGSSSSGSGSQIIHLDGGILIVDMPSAPTGTTVTITAVPDPSKMLNYVAAHDQNGNKLTLTYDGDGNFYFVMPEGGATVSGAFRTEPADPEVTGVAKMLNTDDHIAFMIGDADGNFRPNDNITRAEVAMIFYRLLREKTVSERVTFSDVDSQAWYAEAIETLAALGVLKGVNNSRFEANRSITRAEFAAICARFADSLLGETVAFTDVLNHWASKEISTAAANGWIYGYEDGSFGPDKQITRQEAAAIVNRVLYRLGDQIVIDSGRTHDFPDVNDSMWSWYEISEATYDHNYDFEVGFVHEYWQ